MRLGFAEAPALSLVIARSTGTNMRTGADQDALIIAALAEDSPAAWEAFLRWASGPVWSACLHSSAALRRAEECRQAERG